jgi:hypothetical protein
LVVVFKPFSNCAVSIVRPVFAGWKALSDQGYLPTALMYYASTLFKNIGFNNSTAVGLIIAGVNFVFTLVALRVRKPYSVYSMTLPHDANPCLL